MTALHSRRSTGHTRIANMVDETDRLKEISDRLSEQLIVDPSLFQQMIDWLPDGFLVINNKGEIQLVNRQIAYMFGYSRLALRGQPVHMLLDPKLREVHTKHIQSFFDHPAERPMNFAKPLQGLKKDGRTITVTINLGPLESDQGVLGMALIRRVVDG
jgi:PAS domain S-box-containing protein